MHTKNHAFCFIRPTEPVLMPPESFLISSNLGANLKKVLDGQGIDSEFSEASGLPEQLKDARYQFRVLVTRSAKLSELLQRPHVGVLVCSPASSAADIANYLVQERRVCTYSNKPIARVQERPLIYHPQQRLKPWHVGVLFSLRIFFVLFVALIGCWWCYGVTPIRIRWAFLAFISLLLVVVAIEENGWAET